MPRAFFAIGLAPAITDVLQDCRLACAETDPSWAGEKWVSPENLHLTLRFLGDTEHAALRRYAEAVRVAVSGFSPYELGIGRVRVVPQTRSASMIWAVPEPGADRTTRLAKMIDDAVAGEGAVPDPRRFSPHVTLCRARRPKRLRPDSVEAMDATLAGVPGSRTSMSVRTVMLYTSTLTPEGPVYERIAVMSLGG